MRRIIIILLLVISSTGRVQAKEIDSIGRLPKWATPECLATIGKIVQHEVGNMRDDMAFRFLAEQIMSDVPRLGCDGLTQWRWRIGDFSEKRVTARVKSIVLEVAYSYPHREHPKCQFVGYPGDIPVWRSHGYSIRVDYRRSIGKLTVIGANCG